MTGDLDIEQPGALVAYLRNTGRIGSSETPETRVLDGGVSNRTVYVRRSNGDEWVVKQALAKLRVKVDWFSSPERIHREALGLRWLEQFAPSGSTTPFVFEDFDTHLLAMQAVPFPHENWKTMLLAGNVDRGHVEQFASLLGAVHRASASRHKEIQPLFGDRSYFESLRLEPYYVYTASQVVDASGFIADLLADTRARQETIVHGDYSPKNVLVHDDRLILLDHEVIHLGDPGFDLGFSLTHFLSKAHHMPDRRERFIDATRNYWHTYVQIVNNCEWAANIEPRAVRHTLGCCLARVRGRSPLEYLSEDERARQADVIVSLMADPPATIEKLCSDFIAGIEARE